MTTITSSTSAALYSYANSSLAETLKTTSSTASSDKTETTAKTEDTVTLSSEVSTARTREYLGLAPTGRLTLADFKTAAADQKKTVDSMLTSAMKELGVDADQQVTLSLDSDGNIAIDETFSGKSKLEEALNDDDAFVKAFNGLSANNEVLDYTTSLQTNSVSLMDYLNADTSENALMALATRYSAIKENGSSLASLLRTSRSETPYTYVYEASSS